MGVKEEMTGEFTERRKMLWFWLASSCGLSAAEIHRIRDGGSGSADAEDIVRMRPEEIAENFGLSEQSAEKVRTAAEGGTVYGGRGAAESPERAAEKYRKLAERGVAMLTFYDEGFPDRLRLIPDPPFLLFVKGRLPGTEEPAAAVVGSRRNTDYGRLCTEEITHALADAGCHVISGLAYGIDAYAHRAALDAGGRTSAVMGCGIDECYPAGNYRIYERILESGGAVISEFPPGSPALAWHFPIRNRIISGLADCVLVMEATKKSGTQITVSYALDQGRDVFALPGRVGDPLSAGCLEMIRDGAQILTGADQVIEALSGKGFVFGERGRKKPRIALAKEEKQVYSALSNDPVTPEEVLRKTALSAAAVFRALTRLELEGLAFRTPQGTYYRKRQV
ncbi:MAG: DNA-processing protein DprA [Lachnospiraceae bacterium]|nr:DNA-processing protein DprA [Lachnospiraceae bacterium]